MDPCMYKVSKLICSFVNFSIVTNDYVRSVALT